MNAKEQFFGDNAVVWCYVGRRDLSADTPSSSLPNDSFPVIQSYLDVILHGCRDVGGDDFVKAFLSSTEGWGEEPGSFLDDRAEPAYVRASAVAARSAILIDKALKAVRSDELDNRVPCPTIVGRVTLYPDPTTTNAAGPSPRLFNLLSRHRSPMQVARAITLIVGDAFPSVGGDGGGGDQSLSLRLRSSGVSIDEPSFMRDGDELIVGFVDATTGDGGAPPGVFYSPPRASGKEETGGGAEGDGGETKGETTLSGEVGGLEDLGTDVVAVDDEDTGDDSDGDGGGKNDSGNEKKSNVGEKAGDGKEDDNKDDVKPPRIVTASFFVNNVKKIDVIEGQGVYVFVCCMLYSMCDGVRYWDRFEYKARLVLS